MNDKRQWDVMFGVEVSARYHDWRRGTLELYVRTVKALTFIGAVVTLLTAINPVAMSHYNVTLIVSLGAILIAIVNLWDLVAGYGETARRHSDLYRRFKKLQESMARDGSEWQTKIDAWDADAQAIRADEPPTMWAVYATCWNQTIDRHSVEREGYERKITTLQSILRNYFQFRPKDFPEKAQRAA